MQQELGQEITMEINCCWWSRGDRLLWRPLSCYDQSGAIALYFLLSIAGLSLSVSLFFQPLPSHLYLISPPLSNMCASQGLSKLALVPSPVNRESNSDAKLWRQNKLLVVKSCLWLDIFLSLSADSHYSPRLHWTLPETSLLLLQGKEN